MSNTSRIHSFLPERYGDVKSAVRTLLPAVGGEAQAAACRVSKSTLSEYVNPRYDERHMLLDVVLALERAADAMPVTGHLAAEHGALLLHLAAEETAGGWLDHLTKIGKEAGDVFHRAGEYLADDGEIDAQEAPVLLKASGRTAGGGGSHAVGGAQAHSRRITPLRSKKRPGDGPAEASSS
ncbi:MAG: phage regulatory CII family protein [Alphaproteobacteria bacterium]